MNNTSTVFGAFSILKENAKYIVHTYVPSDKAITEWGILDNKKTHYVKCAIVGNTYPEYVVYVPMGMNASVNELKYACCKEEIIIYNEGIGGIGHLHPLLFDLEWKDGSSGTINI